MGRPVLGIDIAKRKFDVTLLLDGKARHKVCANSADGFRNLLGWLVRQGADQVHACLEATNTFWEALATTLADAGHTVSVVNPARIQAFAGSELLRTKTDRTDAALIARFCVAMCPEPWLPPAPEIRELQALVRRLEALNDMRLQETNRQKTAPFSLSVANSIEQIVDALDGQIAAIEHQIRDHFNQHPGLKSQRDLLTSIPGIGDKTAAVILAELRYLADYDSARQAAAYAGLAPREYTSGTSVRRPARLSKTGNAKLRKALYFPAMVAKKHNPLLQAFAERLKERGKAPKAILGAIMRKLVHLAYGVLKSGVPFDPAYAS